MSIDECFHLGYVIKPHGVKGEVQIFLDSDNPDYYKKLESVFLEINQKLVPFFVGQIQISNNIGIVKFEDVHSFDEAEDLIAANLYLPLSFLPALDEGQFYYHEVIGYTVKDEQLGIIGEVEDIVTFPKHEIFIFRYEGKEVLAPLNEQVVRKVNHPEKILEVSLPDGLLDVYLNL